MANFTNHAHRKMIDLFNNHSHEVGSKIASAHPGKTPTIVRRTWIDTISTQ